MDCSVAALALRWRHGQTVKSIAMFRIVAVLLAFLLSGCATPPAPPEPVSPAAGAPEPKAPAAATPAARASPAKAPAASAPAKPAAGPSPAKAPPPVPPPLDLKTLEQRLKETRAIGVLTKLSLKNQVDDLLEQFRDYYAGRLKVPLAELRRPFDMLLMKVLSLLQDKDPMLAGSIHSSREALWGILADREKFQKLA